MLAVKPQHMARVLEEIAPALTPDQLVLSVAAAISTSFIEERIPDRIPVVRAMPNTPCQLGSGMTVLSAGSHAQRSHLQLAEEIFSSVGRTAILDESLMDGVTGLSGCGPAFLFVIVEALSEAGVKLGIPREVSTLLAAQTMLGSAQMVLDLGAHPALLKDAVTTPAGCTIDGLLELEDGKLRITLMKAVVQAAARSAEMSSMPTPIRRHAPVC